ncbi:hypothetical protein [Anaerorhabdus sp.]|jgi:hypothetical protein|uniref:hypothetical protein n=1 Tax=Anaerorhabdus sp. TaxID=1872524 RepID=UPI002FC664F4
MKSKTLLLNFCGVCLNFYALPLLFRGSPNETLLMLVIMPIITIILGVLYTSIEQPHWFYPLLVGIAFVPTMFLYYNLSAAVFAAIHILGFIVGCLAGVIIKNLFLEKKLSRS